MRMYVFQKVVTASMVLLFAVLKQIASSTPFSTPSCISHMSTPAESALPKMSCAPSYWTYNPGYPAEREASQRYRRDKTSTHLPALS
jgi:hypothetical protein